MLKVEQHPISEIEGVLGNCAHYSRIDAWFVQLASDFQLNGVGRSTSAPTRVFPQRIAGLNPPKMMHTDTAVRTDGSERIFPMWMSEILIVVNPKNVDSNALHEIAGAVRELGALHVEVDEPSSTLTATLASSHVSTVQHIEGVTYIRPTLNWYRQSA